MTRKITQQNGFTLVEILLYVSVVSFVFFTASLLLLSMLNFRAKQLAETEVNETGDHAMRVISTFIRHAETINSPSSGSNDSTLSLDLVGSASDPTVINLSSGVVNMSLGAGSAAPLTSDRVIISNLTFTNVSRTDTPGIIRFEFTATYQNPDSIPAFDIQRTFYGSASLRQP